MTISQDCGLHPPSSPKEWRESFFWGFHTSLGVWGQFNIAFHYHPPRVDRFVVLALPDRTLLALVDIDLQAAIEVETLGRKGYHCLEPFKRWRIHLDAPFLRVPSGMDISLYYWRLVQSHTAAQAEFASWVNAARPATNSQEGELVPVSVDILYEEMSPPYPARWDFLGEPVEHYQSSGRYRGSIVIADRMLTIDGFGPRDHSWGKRDWLRPEWWFILTFALDDGAVHLVSSRTVDGQRVHDGFIFRKEQLVPVTQVEVSPQIDPANGHIVAAEINFATAHEEFALTTRGQDFFHMSVHQEGAWRCHCAETLSIVKWQGHNLIGILEHGRRIKMEVSQ